MWFPLQYYIGQDIIIIIIIITITIIIIIIYNRSISF
jgi:hypothetical protein